jgi:asparagine synthase (glutamine-hydrolysing)
MCGICGTVAADGSSNVEEVRRPMDALSHRGPDGAEAWTDGHCSIGHRRLAIIDLSDRAMEPMPNETQEVWLSFNGEIYNHDALRDDLMRRGHSFRSRTDAEVIVHGYEEWGDDVVHHLRGMFAFAIWDQRNRRLFLARDRVGKKPLFYSSSSGRFFFASELQSIRSFSSVESDIDMEAIDAYL